MAYAKAVSSTAQREAFVSKFRAQARKDSEALQALIEAQSKDEEADADGELLDLVQELQSGTTSDREGNSSIVAHAEAVLHQSRDLLQFYSDLQSNAMSVPEVGDDDQEANHEESEEVRRLLGLGKDSAFARIQNAVGVESEDTRREGVNGGEHLKVAGRFYTDSQLSPSLQAGLLGAEKGVKRMLKNVSCDDVSFNT